MAIGNRYELLDGQSLLSQDCLNVYYYVHTAGLAGNALDLIAAWEINLLPLIRNIQSDQLSHVATAARNLDIPTDFGVVLHVPGLAGNYVQASEPSFVAAAFMMQRLSLATRNARKRYAGVPENEISNGIPTAGYTVNLGTLAVALDNPWLGPAGGIYTPVIMRKTKDPITGNPIYTEFAMGGGQFTSISSQNTRKIGVGS
jgi:hypothetical protein